MVLHARRNSALLIACSKISSIIGPVIVQRSNEIAASALSAMPSVPDVTTRTASCEKSQILSRDLLRCARSNQRLHLPGVSVLSTSRDSGPILALAGTVLYPQRPAQRCSPCCHTAWLHPKCGRLRPWIGLVATSRSGWFCIALSRTAARKQRQSVLQLVFASRQQAQFWRGAVDPPDDRDFGGDARP